MITKFWLVTSAILLSSCDTPNEEFNSIKLISYQGETIYINSINYGVTGDHQITAITKNKDKLKYSTDTMETVSGLNPFLYSFKNDTLFLLFNGKVTYDVREKFESVYIRYVEVSNPAYIDSLQKPYFSQVPNSKPIIYPSNMPKPPNKESK